MTRIKTLAFFAAIVFGILPMASDSSIVHAETRIQGMFKLVDAGNTTSGRYDQAKVEVRIARNPSFDSLKSASMIVVAGPAGARPGAPSGCAIVQSNLWCWGDNTSGRLGDGTLNKSSTPKIVLEGVKDVYATDTHTCALKVNGDLVCAGGDLIVDSRLVTETVAQDGSTSIAKQTSFGTPIASGVVSINDGGVPCIVKTDRSMYCAGNLRPAQSAFPWASSWIWVETGLRSDGEFMIATKEVLRLPSTQNAITEPRVMCTADRGAVSCATMNPVDLVPLSESYIDFTPKFGPAETISGVDQVTALFEVNGSVLAYSNGHLYRSDRATFNGLPTSFEVLLAVDDPRSVVSTPIGLDGSSGLAIVTGKGILAVNYEERANFHKQTALFPITAFQDSTSTVTHSIISIVGKTNSFDLIPMEVRVGERKVRGTTRVTVLAGDSPTVGASISWRSADLTSVATWSPSSTVLTNMAGQTDLAEFTTGPVFVTVWGGVSDRSYLNVAGVLVNVAESGDVIIRLPSPPKLRTQAVIVTNTSGQPVPSSIVTMKNLFRTYTSAVSEAGSAAWSLSLPVPGFFDDQSCPNCFAAAPSLITGENGEAEFTVYETSKKWKQFDPTTKTFSDIDVDVKFDDRVIVKSTSGVLESARQTFILDVPTGVGLKGSRDVTVPARGGAKISLDGKMPVQDTMIIEQVCDVVMSGGLWKTDQSFTSKTCSNRDVFKESLGSFAAASVSCSGRKSSRNLVPVCPKFSQFVRLRVPGSAGSRAVCLVVGSKPCVSKSSVSFGVPMVLQVAKALTLREVVRSSGRERVTATIGVSSRKHCKIDGARLVALKKAGTCTVEVTRSTSTRATVATVRVLVAP